MTNEELGQFVSRLVKSSLSKEDIRDAISSALIQNISEDDPTDLRYTKMLANAFELSLSLSAQLVFQALSKWNVLDLDSIAYQPEPDEERPHIVILNTHRHDQ